MNINLTHDCNNHCPYCFQENKRESSKEITIEDFEKIITKNKEYFDKGHYLALMGGEPTLYSKFKEIISLYQEIYPNNIFQIITNLTGNIENIKFVSKNKKAHFLINTTYDFDKKNTFYNNLKLMKYPENCWLSITLTPNKELNNIYIQRLFEISKKFKKFHLIRVGLMTPKPTKHITNIYNYDEDIMIMLKELETSNYDVITLDCPTNLCMISQKIRNYLNNQNRYIILNLRNEKCKPVADINPDLSSQYCNSCTSPEFIINNILKYQNIDKVMDHYTNVNERYVIKNKKCRNCELFKQKKCFPCHSFDQALIRGELEQIKKEKETKN